MKLDKQQSFTETLYFLWGDHGIKSRMITYEMAAIAREHLAVCLVCTLRNLLPQQAAALLLREVHGLPIAETSA